MNEQWVQQRPIAASEPRNHPRQQRQLRMYSVGVSKGWNVRTSRRKRLSLQDEEQATGEKQRDGSDHGRHLGRLPEQLCTNGDASFYVAARNECNECQQEGADPAAVTCRPQRLSLGLDQRETRRAPAATIRMGAIVRARMAVVPSGASAAARHVPPATASHPVAGLAHVSVCVPSYRSSPRSKQATAGRSAYKVVHLKVSGRPVSSLCSASRTPLPVTDRWPKGQDSGAQGGPQ